MVLSSSTLWVSPAIDRAVPQHKSVRPALARIDGIDVIVGPCGFDPAPTSLRLRKLDIGNVGAQLP